MWKYSNCLFWLRFSPAPFTQTESRRTWLFFHLAFWRSECLYKFLHIVFVRSSFAMSAAQWWLPHLVFVVLVFRLPFEQRVEHLTSSMSPINIRSSSGARVCHQKWKVGQSIMSVCVCLLCESLTCDAGCILIDSGGQVSIAFGFPFVSFLCVRALCVDHRKSDDRK